MISIVVVYNNKQILSDILLKRLENQTAKFELIALDNTEGKFKSAAEALNYGGKQAKCKYILFIHQDVGLNSDYWLENIEKILDDLPKLGIAGVVGMSEKGRCFEERWRGHINNHGNIWPWSRPLQKPVEVQTLDELLLIVPKHIFDEMHFDEKTFDGWHCYGADYCLSVKHRGLNAYVIPSFVSHGPSSDNINNLFEYQKRLYSKHKATYRVIYTTSGDVYPLMVYLHPLIHKCIPLNVRAWINHMLDRLGVF